MPCQPRLGEHPPVFVGRLDPARGAGEGAGTPPWQPTPGLRVSPADGTSEFRDGAGLVP
jgi:hypothetical protein